MPRYGDTSSEASRIVEEQRVRLVRLRKALTPSQTEAARASGTTKDAWHRAETGTARLNTVALARFGKTYDIPVEYVISGRLTGLPEQLARVIVAAEERDAAADRARRQDEHGADNPGLPGCEPASKFVKRNNHDRHTTRVD